MWVKDGIILTLIVRKTLTLTFIAKKIYPQLRLNNEEKTMKNAWIKVGVILILIVSNNDYETNVNYKRD